MKWYDRALSGLLAASMGVSLLGGMPHASAASSQQTVPLSVRNSQGATGGIQTTIRLDYPITPDKVSKSNLKVVLTQNGKTIATGNLETDGILEFTDKSTQSYGSVTLRQEDNRVNYIDVDIQGLSADNGQNTYQLQFTGEGFKPYFHDFTLDKYSQGLIIGTGDQTFTQGDLNGDKKVDTADVTLVKNALQSQSGTYDLNGDGKTDISDLAAITMAAGASGHAQIKNTALIAAKVINTENVQQELTKNGIEVQSGSLASLFQDDGQAVTLKAAQGATEMSLPVPIAGAQEQAVEMEQINIVVPANQELTGTLMVETEDGQIIPYELPTTPQGFFAIQARDDGRKTVTINLGNRVPVKKVTIKVDIVDDKPVVIEQIEFLQDIVPENPTKQDTQVKELQAQAGVGQVNLSWKEFPNITGYKVYYGTSADSMTDVVKTNKTTYTVTGLENLTQYYFAVSPISEAGGEVWEGSKSEIVTAVPQPGSVPDKPDNVAVEAGDSLLKVTWKPGKNTEYSHVQYRKQGEEQFTVLEKKFDAKKETSALITGLQNDTTYQVQVFGSNIKGNGPVSETAIGTPKAQDIQGPTLPTANRIENSHIVSATYPVNNTDTKVSKGTLPQAVYDESYRTSWIANTFGKSRAFTFELDQSYPMNYLIYVPDLGTDTQRNDGKRYRDYFTKIDVSINGQKLNTTFEKVKDNEYFIVKFPKTDVKTIAVEGVQWGGAGNISLSEIAFYQYDPLADEISALFANDSHTELAGGVDQNKINELRKRAEDQQAYYVDREVLLDELNNAQQLLDSKTNELTVITGLESRGEAADREYGQSASALQPLGLTALSDKTISIYVEGLPEGEKLELVQWQQYSETGASNKSYELKNGRNRIYLQEIGNSGSGERGGSLYVQYSGTSPEAIKLQVRDTSTDKNVIKKIPMLNLKPENWYGKQPEERKDLIRPYVEALKTYVNSLTFPNEGAKKTNTRNVTEIATPSVLLSLPANQVLAGLGNTDVETMTDNLYNAIVAWEQLIFLANKTQGIIKQDESFESYQYPMQTRQNIRFSRMFSGAFMFAAGRYIGIEYPETKGMVTGKPLESTGQGVNGLYGWGIAHEIGHNMDKIGYAEITNNIYSLVAQSANASGDMTGTTRLENDNRYPKVFDKVALGKPGQASDVFVQLAMYWQLHLAYDEGGNAMTGAGPLDFFNQFFTEWKNGTHSDALSKDDRIALIAGKVTGKNLTEFFTRWGMQLNASTKDTLKGYGEETREIWYLNDDSRRARLNDEGRAQGATTQLQATAQNEKVTLEITTDQPENVLGYELLRNGTPIAFVMADDQATITYTDEVGSANHMAFTYQVRTIDKQGYADDSVVEEQVRVSYDKVITNDQYDITRQEDGTVVITSKNGQMLTTSGIKISDANVPESGEFVVMVNQEVKNLVEQEPEDIPMIDLVPAEPIVPEEPPVEEIPQEPEENKPETPEEPQVPGETEPEPPEVTEPEEPQTPEGAEPEVPGNGEVTPPTDGGAEEGNQGDTSTEEGEDVTTGENDSAQDSQPEEQPEQPVEGQPEGQQPEDEQTEEILEENVPLSNGGIVQPDGWVVAKSGDFSDNMVQGTGVFLNYFNVPGANDSRIGIYDAQQVTITGIPVDVDLNNIHLLAYPGDNIEFTEGASIGVLGSDFHYGDETIAAGTIVITGSYRGDPLYNTVRINGKFQTVTPGSDDKPTQKEMPLAGYSLLFAEIPEIGEVSTISDGFFLFVPDDQELFKRVNEDHGENPTLKQDVLVELQAQMYQAEDVDGSNPRLTSDTLFISVPRFESMPSIILSDN